MRAFLTMVYRQIKRFWRGKSRVASAIINPIIWLVFFGLGWSKVFDSPMAKQIFGGIDYISFLAPGLMTMGLFTASFISGVTVIWDKQFGFLKETMVAPASRKSIIAGRIFGDAIISSIQGFIILLFTFPLAKALKINGFIPALLVGFILSIAISSMGVSLSLKMASMEGFQMIMMVIMMPLIFLSGAIYPINTMPKWMQYIAYVNPLTYAVDASRGLLLGISKFSLLTDFSVLSIIAIIFLSSAMLLFERATIE
ncbi:MAG: ABC transporter permease [Thermoplasmatales archaeon]|nr:ABC transporter permease [Thermoplasmatales archaeon]